MPVDRIGREEVLRILSPIWGAKLDIARKLRGRIRAVLACAQAHGFVEINVAGEEIDGALPTMPTIEEHYKALPYREVASALETVEASRASLPREGVPAVQEQLPFLGERATSAPHAVAETALDTDCGGGSVHAALAETGLDTRSKAFNSETRTMLQSEIEAALVDPEREPPELDGVPGWRRLKGGAPHPEDLRDIVDAVLMVTRPERVLLFGSGARGEMTDDSDIDILVIDVAPGGTPKLKLAIGNALPMGLRWTDVLVLTPAGLRKRLDEWEDETLAEVLGEARTLY